MTVPELIELLQRLPGDSDLRIVKARSRGKKDRYGQRDESYWRIDAVELDCTQVYLEVRRES